MSVALDRREQKRVINAGEGPDTGKAWYMEGLEATPGIEPGYTVLQTVA